MNDLPDELIYIILSKTTIRGIMNMFVTHKRISRLYDFNNLIYQIAEERSTTRSLTLKKKTVTLLNNEYYLNSIIHHNDLYVLTIDGSTTYNIHHVDTNILVRISSKEQWYTLNSIARNYKTLNGNIHNNAVYLLITNLLNNPIPININI